MASAQGGRPLDPETAIVWRVFGHPPPFTRQCAEAITATDMGFEWRNLGGGCVVSQEFTDSVAALNATAELLLIERHGPGFWSTFDQQVGIEEKVVGRIDSLVRSTPPFANCEKVYGQAFLWVDRSRDGGYTALVFAPDPGTGVFEQKWDFQFDREGLLQE